MVNRDGVATSDLAYLREEALRRILLYAIAALYIWCAVLFPTTMGFGPVWFGPVPLACGVATALAIRKKNPSLAAAALILGMITASLYSSGLDIKVAPYLLAVVVSLTGLLFSLQTVAAVTLVCGGLVIAVGSLYLGYSPFSAELLAPALVIGAVGMMSSLSVRNLYLALYWAWDRAMEAQRNQEELRDRQGQLARTLKALDEAYQRLEHLNYDLGQARAAAEEARLIKQQFVTNVSHELRTPLNVIVAFSEMMYLSPQSYGGVPLPPEYRGDVREIYRSSQHLLRLVEDVLDLSQIEARRMRVYLEPAHLGHLIAEALDIIRPLLREKKIELQADIPVDLPPVLIDRARVRQVLLNLLNNAQRFTEQGGITVRAAVDAEQVKVTVADTGVGIAPGDHAKVFEEFRQLDGSTTRQQGGSGLGLAISKRFVELHGGHIWVESDGVPSHGSQFHFTLPLAGVGSVRDATLYRTPTTLRSPSGRGRTLLLMDQDPAIARMLEQGLEEYRVVPVDDVSKIPALAAELHPRAVVLNPAQGRQAWRQIRELRQKLGKLALPIVLCPLVGERQLGQALGVVDYLVKPISRVALTALLGRLGEGVHRILILDDDPRMVRVLTRMIQSTGRGYDVVRAYSGPEGLLEMQRQRPDLVLLDLVMPEMDGHDVLAKMREDDELGQVPVIAITAQEHTPEEERRLGGKTLWVSNDGGFTNEEALRYLRGVLNAVGVPLPLQLGRQPGERQEQLSLSDRLAQVGEGAQ
jgi:signal transduction histidine kinase/DNA-binding response OmpR family regulator